MILAQSQAAYDGACMVYGRNEARLFLKSPDLAGHAYVQTFTTNGTILNTFAHYSSESQGQVKYHQCLTSSSLLISSYEDFKTGRRRLRNLQDNTKETSEKLRDELNKKWSANRRSSVALNVSAMTALNNQAKHQTSEQVPITDNVRALSSASSALTTLPQSLEDISLSVEDMDQSNKRGQKRTRQTRKSVVIADTRRTRRKL